MSVKSSYHDAFITSNLKNFRATSLDSLANSSNPSDSEDSHDSDLGRGPKAKDTFLVKCEVYAENSCGSLRSWTKSDGSNSENSYDFNASPECNNNSANDKKNAEKKLEARMETIPEESLEPKVSVKEILARFENLKSPEERKDCNNNNAGLECKKSDCCDTKEASLETRKSASPV